MYVVLYGAIQKLPTSLTGSLSFIYPIVAIVVDFLAFGVLMHPLQLAERQSYFWLRPDRHSVGRFNRIPYSGKSDNHASLLDQILSPAMSKVLNVLLAQSQVENIVKIACLHTAESNILVFETAAREIGLPAGVLEHQVRPDLLARAELAGGLTADIASETALALLRLSENADAVVLTCSTLGASIDELVGTTSVPILRVDAALARQAVSIGGPVIALCAVETTLEPTTQLFAEAAGLSRTPFEVRLVQGAWTKFKSGDHAGYLSAISEAAETAYGDGASVVALAQASMAGAAPLVRNGLRPLTSPVAGLTAVVSLVEMLPV
ncbi:hypothetical protein DFI02_12035 [Rhizobium sp. PP-F2F-G20b]|nr:hypothetical protein DFI02_12035 [Rhizobium sp. PP-F2F-G20b]